MNMQMQLASQLSARKRTQEKNQEKAKTWRVGELTRGWEEAELKEDLELDRKTAADRLEICKNNMQFVHEQKMTAIKAFYDDRHEIEKYRRRERDRCWNEEKVLLEQRHGLSQPLIAIHVMIIHSVLIPIHVIVIHTLLAASSLNRGSFLIDRDLQHDLHHDPILIDRDLPYCIFRDLHHDPVLIDRDLHYDLHHDPILIDRGLKVDFTMIFTMIRS